jgi:hypothetical protein
MTAVSRIIQQAYRESNLIANGTEPSADQVTEALERLNSMIAALMGFEVGDALFDWPVGNENLSASTTWNSEQWTRVVAQARILVNLQQATTLFLPPNPDDGARLAIVDARGLLATFNYTLDANSRLIEGSTQLVLNEANLNREWMYRADLGQWVRFSTLISTDDLPFPVAFDDFFITKLAMRLNPRYGRSISEGTAVMLASQESKLRARYHQTREVPADLGAVFMTEGHDRNYRAQGTSRGRNSWMR